MDVKFLDNFIIQSQTDNLKTKSAAFYTSTVATGEVRDVLFSFSNIMS